MKSPTLLGKTGPSVFPISLGCMAMSGIYGTPEDAESVATIRLAIDRGVTLLDTGDFYGMGHNELLIREAIKGQREQSAALREVRRDARPRRGVARVRRAPRRGEERSRRTG